MANNYVYVPIEDIDTSSGIPTVKPGTKTYSSVKEAASRPGGAYSKKRKTRGGRDRNFQPVTQAQQDEAARQAQEQKAKEEAEAAEKARQDFIKAQEEQARRARERLELQARRATGGSAIVQVPQGGTIQLDTKKVDLTQKPQEPTQYSQYGQSVSAQPSRGAGDKTLMTTEQLQLREKVKEVTDSSIYGRLGNEVLPDQVVVDKPSVATLVDRTIVPAKTISEEVYLPDEKSRKKYNDLLKETTVFVYDEQGKPIPNQDFDLRGGSRLTLFLREQQAELRRDQARYNLQFREVERLQNNLRFKQLQKDVLNINKQIESGKEFTKEEADRANKLINEYNQLYNKYEKEFQKLNEIKNKIERGYKGTGKKILSERVEQLPNETKKIQGRLTRGVLVGGIAAYDVGKTVLATQTIAGAVSPLVTGTATGQKIAATVAPVAKVLGSQKALGISGAILGTTMGTREYKQTGDLVYALGAGLGSAGAFYGTTALGQPRKGLTKKQVQQLQKAEGQGKGYIYKDKGEYKIVTFENRRAAGIDSNARTVSTVKKFGDKWVITDGKGFVTITDKQGNIIDTKRFVFDSTTQQAKDKLVLKGQLLDKLKNVEVAKGNVVVEIGNKAIKNQFIGVGIKDGSFITSYVDDFDISKARQPRTPSGYRVEDIKIGKPGEPIEFNLAPRYLRQPFNPQSGIQFEQITKDNVRLLFGGADDSQILSKYALGQLPAKGSARLRTTLPPSTTSSIGTPTVNPLTGTPISTSGASSGITQLVNKQVIVPQQPLSLLGTSTQAATTTALSTLTPFTQGSVSGYASFLIPEQTTQQVTLPDQTFTPKITTSTLSSSVVKQDTAVSTTTSQDTASGSDSASASAQTSTQESSTQKTRPTPTVGYTPTRPNVPTPRIPTKPFGGFPDLPDNEPDPRLSTGKGYYAEYRPEGQKTYKRINTVPQTLMSALSTMARKVDTTLSARGRVKEGALKVGKDRKKVKPKDTGDTYFQRNKYKFRSFKQKKGRRGALKENEFIEKQAFRLDTPGERKKITKARTTKRRTPFGF